MSWDFDDDNVPVPGQPLTGYLRAHPCGDGSRVVVHQLVDTADQAAFMEAAWAMVLGRLKSNIVAAFPDSRPPNARTDARMAASIRPMDRSAWAAR